MARRYEITKQFKFEAAHWLPGHEGKCKNLHGHSYVMEVTIACDAVFLTGSSKGMVMDFVALKKIVQPLIDEWDHALLVGESLPEDIGWTTMWEKRCFISRRTTAENLAMFALDWISLKLPQDGRRRVKKVRIYETQTSWAEAIDDG